MDFSKKGKFIFFALVFLNFLPPSKAHQFSQNKSFFQLRKRSSNVKSFFKNKEEILFNDTFLTFEDQLPSNSFGNSDRGKDNNQNINSDLKEYNQNIYQ